MSSDREKILREALAFYANPFGRTDEDGEPQRVPDFYFEMDFGERARKALASTAPASDDGLRGCVRQLRDILTGDASR